MRWVLGSHLLMRVDPCKPQVAEADRGAESFSRAWSGALPRGFNSHKVRELNSEDYEFIFPLEAILPYLLKARMFKL